MCLERTCRENKFGQVPPGPVRVWECPRDSSCDRSRADPALVLPSLHSLGSDSSREHNLRKNSAIYRQLVAALIRMPALLVPQQLVHIDSTDQPQQSKRLVKYD